MRVEVPNYPGYFVDSDGFVIGRSGRVLKPKLTRDGYHEIVMTNPPSERKCIRVHRLVALCFIGECPEGYVVDHIDSNRVNNKLENLTYVTYAENVQKASRIGNIKCKGRSYASLSREDFWKMYELHCSGKSYSEIRDFFGLECRSDYIGELLSGRKLSSISGFTKDMRYVQRSETIT